MGLEHVMEDRIVTRGGAQANSRPFRIGGQACDIHGVGPVAAVMSVQISNDGHNWVAATDADGAAITNVNATNWYREIRERAEFVRGTVAAGAAADYHFRFGAHKSVG